MHISIFIPPELEKNSLQIKRFFDAMVAKLRKNAHKPSFERSDAQHCLTRIVGETEELRVAIAEGNSVEILLEGADVANFALLAATSAIDRDGKGESGQDPKHDQIKSDYVDHIKSDYVDHIKSDTLGTGGRTRPIRWDERDVIRANLIVSDRIEATATKSERIALETTTSHRAGDLEHVETIRVYDPRPAMAGERPREAPVALGATYVAPESAAPPPGPAPAPPLQSEGDELGRQRYEADLDPTLLHSETSREPMAEVPPMASEMGEPKQYGYTGNVCTNCGGFRLVQTGHCETCQDCHTTTGCS